MRSIFILIAVFIFIFQEDGNAQDVIIKTTGEELNVKVTEITVAEILYKNPDSLQGPTLSIPKADVFMIKYANGATELIKLSLPADTLGTVAQSPEMMYLKGRADAREYYKAPGVFWGSAAAGAATLFTSGVSLAVPVIVAATPPKPKYLRAPDPTLMRNQEYRRGYKKQAHKRKVGKAAAGTGAGILASVALVTALLIAYFP